MVKRPVIKKDLSRFQVKLRWWGQHVYLCVGPYEVPHDELLAWAMKRYPSTIAKLGRYTFKKPTRSLLAFVSKWRRGQGVGYEAADRETTHRQ
jgi:hypothetical protein